MVEAEFHAVWMTLEGNLVDTTPAVKGFTRILFLPAPEKIFTGRQVDNIRTPLIDNPLMHEFINNCVQEFGLFNKGIRANMVGAVRFSLEEAETLKALKLRQAAIQQMLELCPCGSGVRFYKCCGSD
jgi:hypothetical protein